MKSLPIVLASSSPRRKELLDCLGLSFSVHVANVDEHAYEDESPDQLVARLALSKAEKIAELHPNHVIIGADTVVVFDKQIMGKPIDKEQAFQYLKRLSGNMHRVFTGVALVSICNQIKEVSVSSTDVFFRELSDQEILEYIKTGDPLDKAGAYAIQGLGAMFVEKIEGDYFTVVGLPLCKLSLMLKSISQPVLGEGI